MTFDLVTFAARFNISPAEAHVLPALFDGAARKIGMAPSALLAAANGNMPLGQYLADCARELARQFPR